jgi:hypothetical protein
VIDGAVGLEAMREYKRAASEKRLFDGSSPVRAGGYVERA